MHPIVAHGGRPDELVAEMLLAGALVAGWVGRARIRRSGFPRIPRSVAWGLVGTAGALAVLAILVPTVLLKAPTPSLIRPTTNATIQILSPVEDQRVTGPMLEVTTRLEGARVVSVTSTTVTTDTGHVHVYLDDRLLSMSYAPEEEVPIDQIEVGPHTLRVEFVAADHGPFDPPVTATVDFVKVA
jgi:hypothetical protein